MVEVLSNSELVEAVKNNQLMTNGAVENCEEIKYDFRLGENILKSSFRRPVKFSELTVEEKSKCSIAPGEVVFVMTQEKLNLPNNIFCQLSNKRKIGHGGIIVLGGLMIDPNYNGRLIFGLYNVSSAPYQLKPGKKLAAGIFYRTDKISDEDNFSPEPLDDFPEELVDSMTKYEPFSPTNATQKIDLMESRIKFLEDRINTDNEWKTTFKESLNDVVIKLGTITDNLREEVAARQLGQSGLEKKLSVLRGIGMVLGALVGGGLTSLLIAWLTGVFNLG